ncbi:MAG: A/G-specific adenine glycosylase [Gemmataceae bacterium]
MLEWFDSFRRDLPWRLNRDPYRIWVSEVMLQQTQVSTVVGYFERFLARWPSLADLAQADEQEVLHLWQGLGYYRRARDLLRAAKILVQRYPDGFPCTPQQLRDIPGLGEYTRNAVLSQAFDVRLPILETNTQRLLSRLFARQDDPRHPAARRWLWAAAETLLPDQRVGDFNQALMELGALVCTPTQPRCLVCPVRDRCAAYALGLTDQIPRRDPAPAPTELRELSLLVHRRNHWLLVQRPSHGRWANLWEFPRIECLPQESLHEAALRCAALVGLCVAPPSAFTVVKHGVTRFRITLHAWRSEWQSGEFRSELYPAARWLNREQLPDLPLSSPQRRLIAALLADGSTVD